MGHSVLGLSHFPTLITPTVTWQDDTLQGCRIKTCLIKVSVLYYNMTICLFFSVPDAYSPDHTQSNWAPLPPPPPLALRHFTLWFAFQIMSGINLGVVFQDQDSSCVFTLPILVIHDLLAKLFICFYVYHTDKESNICIFRCTWVILKLFIQ